MRDLIMKSMDMRRVHEYEILDLIGEDWVVVLAFCVSQVSQPAPYMSFLLYFASVARLGYKPVSLCSPGATIPKEDSLAVTRA
jgi:hypothetical protein